MSEFVPVGKKKDFPNNEGTAVEVNGKDICVVNANGKFYSFENQCTHAQSLLSGGEVEDGEIACPLHGARFDVATGEARTLPAVEPVKIFEVKIDGEQVLVKLD